MGLVYKAEDLKLKRIVALKFLPPAFTMDLEAKRRFIIEAQAASSLQHNNICSIHEIDEIEDRQMFICMDFYEGETLKKKIADGPLNVEEAVDIAVQLAHGLAEAHEHGIIHRDIKPANILITRSRVVKILDFGLAKLVGGSMLTGEGTTMGTAAYMSPEQLLGEEVDARSDIFAMGIIMFEMLTQKLPFKGEHASALMYSIINDEPLNLKDLRKDIPENLIEFCKRCLQKDADDRPHTMKDALRILGVTERTTIVVVRRWRHWPRWARVGVATSAAVALAISLWLARPFLIPSSQPERVKPVIAVLPFRNLTGHAETAEWPDIVQNMIIDGFLGVEDLAVLDRLTLNNFIENSPGINDMQRNRKLFDLIKAGKAQYLVEGSIGYSGNRYVIKYSLVDPSAGGPITTSEPITISGEDSLSSAVRNVSNQILNYLQVKGIAAPSEKDIRPWIARGSQNIEALREFMQASQMSFNGVGSPSHLRRAIELDSTFISPRIWLISGLIARGELKEAQAHYETLKRLEPSANPFERALIGWAGAYIAHDTISKILYLKTALDYSPGNNVLLLGLARVKMSIKDYRGAIDALLPTVKMKWQYSRVYSMLATCYNELKEYTKAKEILEQSLSLRWVDYNIYNLLSIYALRDKDTTKAREHENAFLQRGKEDGVPLHELYATLGSNNLSEGFYNSAVRYYQTAASMEPKNAEYHNGLGEAFFHFGNHEGAKKEFLLAIRIDPKQALAHLRLGELSDIKKDTSASIRYFNAYLKLDTASSRTAEVRQRVLHMGIHTNDAANP